MTDWIEHDGKGYPDLPMGTLVQVRFRDGEKSRDPGQMVVYWNICWRHDERLCSGDIVAYRVVKS